MSVQEPQSRARDDGFTLIELLVVVVIIGILIAIAIPLYLNYEKGSSDKAAQSDLRNSISTMALCRSTNGNYPTALGTTTGNSYAAMTGCTSQTVTFSAGTVIKYFPSATSTPTAYVLEATNTNGTGAIFCYSSATAGSVGKTTATGTGNLLTAYQTACPS